MMRTSFTLFLLLLSFTLRVSAQTAPSIAAHLKFALRDTVPMADLPRDELYSRAWRWFSEASQKVPSLLEEANKRDGRFTGTSSVNFESKLNGGSDYVKGRIYYNFTVFVEDGFYTYELTDFTHVARISFNTLTIHPRYPYRTVANEEWHTLVWQEMKDKITAELKPMIESLQAGMDVETDKLDQYKAIRSTSPESGD